MSASAAVKEKPASAAAPVVSHEEFLTHMQAMTKHYTGTGAARPTASYALPVHLMQPLAAVPAATGTAAGKAAVNAALAAGQAKTKAFTVQQQTVVQGAMTKLQKDHDTTSWEQQMAAAEDQAQKNAHDTIHQQFSDLIAAGKAHPELQSTILTLTNKIGAFFTNLLASVGAFLQKIAKQVVAWIKAAVEWVEKAGKSVGDWVSGAVSSVGHFFSNLF